MPEWRTTLDALQELPQIGADGPVGYYGLNMGTAIGVPLTAAEPRITAAVLGLFWPGSLVEAASRITHKELPRFESDSAVRFFARHPR